MADPEAGASNSSFETPELVTTKEDMPTIIDKGKKRAITSPSLETARKKPTPSKSLTRSRAGRGNPSSKTKDEPKDDMNKTVTIQAMTDTQIKAFSENWVSDKSIGERGSKQVVVLVLEDRLEDGNGGYAYWHKSLKDAIDSLGATEAQVKLDSEIAAMEANKQYCVSEDWHHDKKIPTAALIKTSHNRMASRLWSALANHPLYLKLKQREDKNTSVFAAIDRSMRAVVNKHYHLSMLEANQEYVDEFHRTGRRRLVLQDDYVWSGRAKKKGPVTAAPTKKKGYTGAADDGQEKRTWDIIDDLKKRIENFQELWARAGKKVQQGTVHKHILAQHPVLQAEGGKFLRLLRLFNKDFGTYLLGLKDDDYEDVAMESLEGLESLHDEWENSGDTNEDAGDMGEDLGVLQDADEDDEQDEIEAIEDPNDWLEDLVFHSDSEAGKEPSVVSEDEEEIKEETKEEIKEERKEEVKEKIKLEQKVIDDHFD